MSISSIKAAYEVAKQVYLGEISPGNGARKLETDNGLNRNSARDMIMVFRHLMQGDSFQRGLSAPDMDYFLSRISREYGPITLRTAVNALWLHLRYYEGIRRITMRKLRAVAAKYQAEAATLEPLADLKHAFDIAVRRSLAEPSSKRRERLQSASKIPMRTPVVLYAYLRNPDVIAEVLDRAAGKCERCNCTAPFLRRKNNLPYLEVHHRIQLADGGEDTVENAQALCPNCHRELHYGVETNA
jgi:5-methylcytosine-specific restriction enzyme A